MTLPLPERIVDVLDKFNAAYPWSHNAHWHKWILRQLLEQVDSALDVGCGAGDLARLLATRATTVHGIDADPVIIAHARESTDPAVPVSFVAGDAMTELPGDAYDVITCVATIHHVPFTEALTRFRRHLQPNGTIVVVGLYVERTTSDHLLELASVPLNAAVGWLKNKGRKSPRRDDVPIRTRPPTMTFAELVREANQVLPGVRLRRRLFWRYTLVWHADGRQLPGSSMG